MNKMEMTRLQPSQRRQNESVFLIGLRLRLAAFQRAIRTGGRDD